MANIPISDKVLQDPALSLAEKGFYACFCYYAGDNGSCPYGLREFAAILDISPVTFGGYVSRLIELGYISVIKAKGNGRGNKHCVYTVNHLKEVDL